MKYNNRDVELAVVAKVNYTNGFIKGFMLQSDTLTAMTFFLLGTVITLLWTKFF